MRPLEVLALGWIVLAGAVVLNVAGSAVGLQSWYDVTQGDEISAWSWPWLLVLYPAGLGISAIAGRRLLSMRRS
jgi:hypothetical protein